MGAVRKSVDDEQKNGLYILTGSTSQTVDTPHTGILRISTLMMRPMSLYESMESNGQVSLRELFDHPSRFEGSHSDLDVDALIFAICCGGWPRAIDNETEQSKLQIAKELYKQTYSVDISNIDGIRRNAAWAENILKSCARNLCTPAPTGTVFQDASSETGLAESSLFDYYAALKKLFIVDDVEAWCPAIRSKSAIRAAKKRNLIDPSIAVAAMGLNPEYFNTDFKTLGFLFEYLCIRDLKVYSSAQGGQVSYYCDRYGLEADTVLHLDDGRYALINIKLGANEIDMGAKHLN